MKVQIRDKVAMESLTIANLRAYLEAHGWGDERPWGTWATIFSKEERSKIWEVAVPNEVGGLIYAESVAEIIATLSEAEDRSQLDVFGDLTNWSIDRAQSANHKRANEVPNIWRVGAEKGKYTDSFVAGGYAATGWIRGSDLTKATGKEALRCLYKKEYPQDGDARVSTNVGQIHRFMVGIKPGDYVITPTKEHTLLRFGRVESSVYYQPEPDDGCPFPHRRQVDWAKRPLDSREFPEKLCNSMKFAELTVFSVRHREEFFAAVIEALWPNARWL